MPRRRYNDRIQRPINSAFYLSLLLFTGSWRFNPPRRNKEIIEFAGLVYVDFDGRPRRSPLQTPRFQVFPDKRVFYGKIEAGVETEDGTNVLLLLT